MSEDQKNLSQHWKSSLEQKLCAHFGGPSLTQVDSPCNFVGFDASQVEYSK